MFAALRKYCHGQVLDIGGWDFYLMARAINLSFTQWTTLENCLDRTPQITDERFRLVHGDGCAMALPDNEYDTVLNIQVLEHVLEPLRMIAEIARVLKPGGYAIILIPQTSLVHMAPHHYGNFTQFWVFEACASVGLRVVDHKPLGGLWTTMASHYFYFFLKVLRHEGMVPSDTKRNAAFYVLLPFMLVYAAINIPICLFFGLGDLTEDPNNHLVVVTKPEPRAS
jgi:SAM-dependent methyltransferase